MPDPGPAIAQATGEFFNSLIAQKLERKEALELTMCYLSELLDPERREEVG